MVPVVSESDHRADRSRARGGVGVSQGTAEGAGEKVSERGLIIKTNNKHVTKRLNRQMKMKRFQAKRQRRILVPLLSLCLSVCLSLAVALHIYVYTVVYTVVLLRPLSPPPSQSLIYICCDMCYCYHICIHSCVASTAGCLSISPMWKSNSSHFPPICSQCPEQA